MQVSTAFQGNIYEQSSAYRKAHSCKTTLINLVEEWKRARDNRLAAAILSTDTCPKRLILSTHHFQEGIIQLLKSYRCDRKYRAKLAATQARPGRLVEAAPMALPWVH